MSEDNYKTAHEVEQILGKALGYPWFKDDLKNFPDATEADGVCVGEHVPETIAAAAANRIKKLEAQLSASQERERILREGLGVYARSGNWAYSVTKGQYRNLWMRWENGYDIAERTIKAAEEVKG